MTSFSQAWLPVTYKVLKNPSLGGVVLVTAVLNGVGFAAIGTYTIMILTIHEMPAYCPVVVEVVNTMRYVCQTPPNLLSITRPASNCGHKPSLYNPTCQQLLS